MKIAKKIYQKLSYLVFPSNETAAHGIFLSGDDILKLEFVQLKMFGEKFIIT